MPEHPGVLTPEVGTMLDQAIYCERFRPPAGNSHRKNWFAHLRTTHSPRLASCVKQLHACAHGLSQRNSPPQKASVILIFNFASFPPEILNRPEGPAGNNSVPQGARRKMQRPVPGHFNHSRFAVNSQRSPSVSPQDCYFARQCCSAPH